MRALILGMVMMAGLAQAETMRDAVTLTNNYRAQKGLGPLTVSPALEATADAHARDMAKKGFFSHRGSDGSTPGKRAKRKGYRYCIVAENIAKGPKNSKEAVKIWINSKGHRANMLLRKAREIGVVRRTGNIWVMVLAAPGC